MNYTLYLDESETHTFNKDTGKETNPHFCMAGIIVADNDIEKLKNSINTLKKTIWNDIPYPEEIVLHQMRINEAEKGRLDISKYPEYSRFKHGKERKKLYQELKKIFDQNDITIVGSCISENNMNQYYGLSGKNKQDQYLIAMQLILENYLKMQKYVLT